MNPAETERYHFGRFELDATERWLRLDGKRVSLEPKAFDVLLFLIQRGGRLVGKEEIMQAVWPDTFVEDGNLTRNISLLRRVLADGLDEKSIETVPKHGYRFLPEVSAANGHTETEIVAEKHTITRIITEEEVGNTDRSRRSGFGLSLLVIGGATVLVLGVAFAVRQYVKSKLPGRAQQQSFQNMHVSRFTASGNVLNAAISPDGKYVATVITENGMQSLWMREVAANTSAIRVVAPALVEYWGLTFSNDSNFIYYVSWVRNASDAELYELPVFGGTPRKLPAVLDSPISFSPSGDRFAYVFSSSSKGESYLTISDLSGKNVETIASRPKPQSFALYPGGPGWSPDGKFIAYGAGSSSQMQIVVANVQTKEERPLNSQSWKEIGRVIWLRDGSGVIFSGRDQMDAPRQLWFVSYPDGALRKITNDLDDYTSVSLTGDGKTLAAVHTREKSSISVANARNDPTNATEIFSEVGAGRERITWTPDNRLLFCSRASGNWDIWSMNKDGSGAKQLTFDLHNDLFPAISADGASIFFASDRGGNFNIWRMKHDGNDPVQLTRGAMESLPEVSADGQWVVYAQNISYEPSSWKMSAMGGEPERLSSALSSRPVVSPDGKQVAYVYLDEKEWGVAVRPLSGNNESAKKYPFPSTVLSRFFRWSPDGQSIAYIAAEAGAADVWLQPLNGGPAKRLTNFKREGLMSFAWSFDGQWSAYIHSTATSDVVLLKDAH
jgi:Tol biopolymer transport system component/DNA-binding winged helix-turn-helix (wHTH) protein